MNLKKKELIKKYYRKLKNKFPEISFVKIILNPVDSTDCWLIISNPISDDIRDIELDKYASQLSAFILEKYGYLFLIMSDNSSLIHS